MRARFISLLAVALSASVFAQTNDPVIMTINDKNFKKSEFEYYYNKFNREDVIDKRSLDDYVGLFKDLKLKVAEAEAQGMDTMTSYRLELSEYRTAEAKPYLENMEVNNELIKRAYDRTKSLLEISQILIPFSEVKNNNFKTFPSDTFEAYNKAVQIRNRLLKGEDFGKVAAEVAKETNIPQTEKPGYLGWFTGLMLTPSFEDVAYNTPVGKIGPLARTNFGYHIIKINAKKDNPGSINVAHILIPCPPNADSTQVSEARTKINDIYAQLKSGGDFAALAKEFSKDPGTASKGGDLGWLDFVASTKLVKEFKDAAWSLTGIGEITAPFQTQFGYHIVKLLGKKPLEPLDEKRKDIINTYTSGGYFIPLHQNGIDKMKKEFGFRKNDAVYQTLFSKANTVYPTDSIFYTSFQNEVTPLFTVGDTKYTVNQFITYLKKNNRSAFTMSNDLLNDCLQTFEYSALYEVKDKSLESKYPDFKNLIQEYRDGILMFNIMNREVWEKASNDTEGLAAFFEKNKQRYAWSEPYYKGYVVLVKDAKAKQKMQKEIAGKDNDKAVQYLLDNYKVGDVSYVKVEKRGMFKKGEDAFVDEGIFKSGVAERPEGFGDFLLLGKLLKAPESYTDVRGPVVTDYQNYLEEIWLKKLNEKYKVKIFPDVIKTIK